jgi:hypothetical protein
MSWSQQKLQIRLVLITPMPDRNCSITQVERVMKCSRQVTHTHRHTHTHTCRLFYMVALKMVDFEPEFAVTVLAGQHHHVNLFLQAIAGLSSQSQHPRQTFHQLCACILKTNRFGRRVARRNCASVRSSLSCGCDAFIAPFCASSIRKLQPQLHPPQQQLWCSRRQHRQRKQQQTCQHLKRTEETATVSQYRVGCSTRQSAQGA